MSEFTNKATSDFVVKNYRSKQSMLSRGKSAKDLFEFNEKGILIMKDEKGALLWPTEEWEQARADPSQNIIRSWYNFY